MEDVFLNVGSALFSLALVDGDFGFGFGFASVIGLTYLCKIYIKNIYTFDLLY